MVATNDNFNQAELNSLLPFKTEAACVYEKKYLSGFMAEGYQKNLEESWKSGKNMIASRIRSNIINSLHCDVVDYLNVSTTYSDVKFKYMLLPIYTLVYLFKKKKYVVRVNGSTGKVKGKTPLSPIRVAIASILGIALVGLLIWFFSQY
jgi:hypothetical protein